jgi:hypothetical protein
MVSFTGEKLSQAQVLAAAEHAFLPVGGKYEFISAVGEMNGRGPRYAFLTEFEKMPGPSKLREIVCELDKSLCSQNGEYASKRKSLRLDPPVLRVVRRGEFDKYRKRKVSNGSPDGQFKILRLTDDQSFAQEFAVVRDVEWKAETKRTRKLGGTRRNRKRRSPLPTAQSQ